MLQLLVLSQSEEQERVKKRQMREFTDIAEQSTLTAPEKRYLQELKERLFPETNTEVIKECHQSLTERSKKLPKPKHPAFHVSRRVSRSRAFRFLAVHPLFLVSHSLRSGTLTISNPEPWS